MMIMMMMMLLLLLLLLLFGFGIRMMSFSSRLLQFSAVQYSSYFSPLLPAIHAFMAC